MNRFKKQKEIKIANIIYKLFSLQLILRIIDIGHLKITHLKRGNFNLYLSKVRFHNIWLPKD